MMKKHSIVLLSPRGPYGFTHIKIPNMFHYPVQAKHLKFIAKIRTIICKRPNQKVHFIYIKTTILIKWVEPCEKAFSSTYGQQRPRSACASAQSDQGLRCPLTESLVTIWCINGEGMPGWDFAQAWDESASVHIAHARKHFFARRRPNGSRFYKKQMTWKMYMYHIYW